MREQRYAVKTKEVTLIKLKPFTIVCSIESAAGHQSWEVMAKDADDAIRRFKAGEACEFLHQEIEVQCIGEPEVMDYQDE